MREYMKTDRHKNTEKWNARSLARKNVEKLPCEICGNPKTDAHHEDYSKPLEVHFLCHLHHQQYHAKLIQLPS